MRRGKGRGPGFHSTKEGFKGRLEPLLDVGVVQFPFHPARFQGRQKRPPGRSRRYTFPFHQGRFQGDAAGSARLFVPTCFHSTKEGFKVVHKTTGKRLAIMFPFHQGRFQGTPPTRRSLQRGLVSIPPRKVSRYILRIYKH